MTGRWASAHRHLALPHAIVDRLASHIQIATVLLAVGAVAIGAWHVRNGLTDLRICRVASIQ